MPSSTFACLVAETGGPKRSNEISQNQKASSPSSSVAQQRRAKISIDASTSKSSIRPGNSLFSLKVEYNSTATPRNQRPSSPLVSTTTTTERKFSFQIGISKIEWVSPTSDQDDSKHNTAQQQQQPHHHHHHYEHTLKLSKMVSQNNEDQIHNKASAFDEDETQSSLVITFNLIITFERYLEARMFARQLHWLVEVYLPSSASTTLAPSSSFSLSPTTQACALVALPIQWWFEAWSLSVGSNGAHFLGGGGRSRVGSFFPGAAAAAAAALGLTDSSKNSPERYDDDDEPAHQGVPPNKNGNKNTQKNVHPPLTSNPALILSSSGIANWTWSTNNSDEGNGGADRHKKDQQHLLAMMSEDKILGAEAHTAECYSFSVPSVLPLLESPKPTQKCDEKSFAWAPCFSAPMLSSAIEGSTVFYRPSSSSSSNSATTHFEATLKAIGTEYQPVPLHQPAGGGGNSKNNNNNDSSGTFDLTMSITASFSVADVVAAAQQELADALAEAPTINSKNIATMNMVSTVLLDSISKRLFVSEKTGGSSMMEMMLLSNNNSNNASNSKTSPSTIPSVSNNYNNKKCEFVSRTSLLQKNANNNILRQSSQPQQKFVAVPLQEAIVEASSYADNFLLEESNSDHHIQQRLKTLFHDFYLGPNTSSIAASARVLCVASDNFSSEPTPIVYDVKKKSLVVLNRTPETASQHWATLLVESCFPSCFGSPSSLEILSNNNKNDDETETKTVPHLIPIILLPTRNSPAFPNPNNNNHNSTAGKVSNSHFDPRHLLLSEGISFFANSGGDNNDENADSSLHDILLVSALRNSIFGPIGSAAASVSSFLLGGHSNNQNVDASSSSSSSLINLSKLLLHKPKSLPHINIIVAGSVGCGKSTLIKALSRGLLSSGTSNISSTDSYFASSTNSTTMAEDLIFSCSYDTFNGYSPITSAVFSCCSASKRAVADKFNKVQPAIVEAPAQSLPALSGAIATSDVVLLLVNCLDPHSLAWIEEKVRPLLDQERTPCLTVDAESLHYASSPSVILVTVNSTSYRRTVTPEEITHLAKKLKCQVADLEFGENSSNHQIDDNNQDNRLSSFSVEDAKVLTATLGRSVQALAGYSRLVNTGWLPLHADWLILSLTLHSDRIFLMKNRQSLLNQHENSTLNNNNNENASVTPRANEEENNSNKRSNNIQASSTYLGKSLLCTVLEDPGCVGINEHISQWIESDLIFTGGCPFSVYDCANHIATMCASRDIRGQLVKLMCLKNCVQRRSVLKMISSIQSLPTDVWGNKKFGASNKSNTGRTSPNYNTGTNSSRYPSPRENDYEDDEDEDEENLSPSAKTTASTKNGDQHDAATIFSTKTKKTAKKLFSLFSKKPTKDEIGDQNSNDHAINLDSSYAIFQHETTNGKHGGGLARQNQDLGLTPSAVLFLMTAFGVVVPVSWVHSLWNEIVLATGSSGSSSAMMMNDGGMSSSTLSSVPPVPQSLWLKFLNVILPGSSKNNNISARHPSVFTTKQLAHADFSFVIFHWILEIAKTSSSEFYSSVRSGWLARPSDVDAEVNKSSPSSTSDNEDDDPHLNPGSTPTKPKNNTGKKSAPSSPLSPKSASFASASSLATIRCRHCGQMRTNDQVVRCVVCERKCCIIGDKRCTLFVGGRDADQRKQALLSIARTSGGASDEKTIAMMLKQLPHVCQVCLMAHPPITWQMDEEATSCYCCGARFTITKRRHHCRRDGTVVCAPCSRFEGPAFGYATVQRMCTSCYDAPSPFVALTESDSMHHEHQHNHNKQHRAAGTTRNQDDDLGENNNNHNHDNKKQHGNNNFATFDYYNLHENPSDDENEHDDDEIDNKRGKIDDEGENYYSSSSSDDDDDDDDDEAESSLDLESTSTLSRSFFSKNNSGNGKGNNGRIEDPRVVFAPWAHLVLNSEPNTVYKQPWYETINEHVVDDVLTRIRGMIQRERNKFDDETPSNARVIPRAEYVVRQPGYLEEADKEIEDAAIGEDYPSEFDPDE